MSWRASRACEGVDPAVFMPRGIGRNVYTEARAICAACPVTAECLAAVMLAEGTKGPRYRVGMFAGTTPKQRAAMSKREHRVCVVCASPFVSIRVRMTCSPQCAKVRKTDWYREYQQLHRYSHGPNPIPRGNRHGSNAQASTGCKCTACKGRKRQNQRRARAVAAGRSKIAQNASQAL